MSEKKKMGRAIGIDLGTTNSVMAVYDRGENKIIHNKENEYKTRSIVCYWKGEFLVGRPAVNRWSLAPRDTIVSVKRLMGRSISDAEVKKVRKSFLYEVIEPSDGTKDSVRVILGGKERSPEEISAMILKKLKADAELFLGEEVTHAVITVPAYFSDKQKEATWRAGIQAGLVVMKILDEPTAAAIAYGLESDSSDAQLLVVYDLGGGTFDVSVLMMSAGTFVPLSLEGDMWLGGDDFDQKIVDKALQLIKSEYGIDPSSDAHFMITLRERAREAKETLSSAQKTEIIVSSLLRDQSGSIIPFEMEISRQEFEEWIEPLVNHSIDLVDRAIKNAGFRDEEVDYVIVAGNASSVPLIHRKLEEKFGKEKILKSIHPKYSVAMGASIIATYGLIECPNPNCQEQNSLGTKTCKCGTALDFLLCPFCNERNETNARYCHACNKVLLKDYSSIAPFNYGIQTEGDKFSVFIRKGEPIPTPESERRIMTFQTRYDGQRLVSMPVYGGNNFECASKNEKQGIAFAVLPADCPKNTPVLVCLWLNDHGFFEIKATLEDGTDLKPRILRGDADQKAEEYLIKLEERYQLMKDYLKPEQCQQYEQRYEEIVVMFQKQSYEEAMGKSEQLMRFLDSISKIPEERLDDARLESIGPDERVRRLLVFIVYILQRYDFIMNSAERTRLVMLVDETRDSLEKGDDVAVRELVRILQDNIDKLLDDNQLFRVLFYFEMKIEEIKEYSLATARSLESRFETLVLAIKQGDMSKVEQLIEEIFLTIADVEPEPQGASLTVECPNPKCKEANPRGKIRCQKCGIYLIVVKS